MNLRSMPDFFSPSCLNTNPPQAKGGAKMVKRFQLSEICFSSPRRRVPLFLNALPIGKG